MTDKQLDEWTSPMAGLAYDQADRFNMEYADELSPETYEHQNRMIQEAAQKPRSAPQYTP